MAMKMSMRAPEMMMMKSSAMSNDVEESYMDNDMALPEMALGGAQVQLTIYFNLIY
jgi:hypothetical protein